MVELPKGVRVIRRGKRTWYYFQKGRGTKDAGPPIAMPGDPTDPAFWLKYREITGATPTEGTFNHLTGEYRRSGDFTNLRLRTQQNYESFLQGFEQAWGTLRVRDLTRQGVYAYRDTLKKTPVTANHMLSVLRTFLEFCVERGHAENNVAIAVKRLQVDDDGARPWPEAVYAFVVENAPTDLKRMAILGRACGQRREDLVRMKPADRRDNGIGLRIGKKREKRHWVPMTEAACREIDSWGGDTMAPYILSPTGAATDGGALYARWGRWLKSDEAKPIVELVKQEGVNLHGLRATAVVDRRLAGLEHQQIAAQLGLSLQMVMRYSRFCDQETLARSGMARLEERGKN